MNIFGQTNSPQTVIKKYPNRRLYDTSRNSHVTLSELADRIKTGERIQIVDSKSGEDLTMVTMGQVLFETLRTRPDYLPPDLILLMIRAQDNVVRDFLYNGVPQAFQMYIEAHRRMMGWMPQGYPNFQNFGSAFPSFFGAAQQPNFNQNPPQQTQPEAPSQPRNDERESLKREIEELKTEIQEMKRREHNGKGRKSKVRHPKSSPTDSSNPS